MLSRTAFRAVRATPALAAPRPACIATSQRIRFYANKSGRDNTWKPSDTIRFGTGDVANKPGQNDALKPTDPVTLNRANKSRLDPVQPNEQPEFDSAAAPERNTAPSQALGPGIPAAERPEASNTQKPLPDLRQGIPSTFSAEFGDAGAAPKTDAHNATNGAKDSAKEPGAAAGGREAGELPKSAYETSTDRRRNRVANWSYLIVALLGTATAVFMGRNWESEAEERAHPDAPSGWNPGLMYKRAYARLSNQMNYYTEPTFPKLLPDMDPAPPLTLVLSLEDLLVHSEWSTTHGWRTAKRPGVDYFLRYLSQYYELVIFTSVKNMDADPIIRKLDPFRIVMWPLFREATRYEKGEYVKDLSCLNRDLAKTIIIDTHPGHVKLQPENAIILPKWEGQPGDKGLVALIPFLEYLAMLQQGGDFDVRSALKSMEGKDIPTEFARREAKLRAEFMKDMGADRAKKTRHSASGFLMGALGMGSGQRGGMVLSDGTNLSEGMAQGKMMIDMFRDIGRKNYETMEKEIQENGDKWLKEMAEEEKKLQDEMVKSMKSNAFGWFGGSASPNPPGSRDARNQATS